MPSSATPRAPEESPPSTAADQRPADTTTEETPPLTLIDASALIALLGNEPAAGEVREILKEAAAITALNLAEAVDRLGRRYGLEMERVRPVIDGLLEETLTLIPVDSPEAWRAAEIRTAHYHRTSCPLSLADVVLIASSGSGRRIATSDTHVARIARQEGIPVIALPNSQGDRPE
jgi:PIN domain nuclease of toxin-antitoxin system